MSTGAPSRASASDNRLISLDALRGADMFWIIGGKEIAIAAAGLTGWSGLMWFEGQLEHPDWNGFTFYDLIFPLFLFIAGAAMPMSFEKRLARGDTKSGLYRHAVQRGLTLVLLGMLYNRDPDGILNFDWPNSRLPSVLGRIGLAYMFAAFIVLNTSLRGRLMWIAGLLVGYWAALKFVPVPGYGAGDLSPGHTLTDFVDRTLIPGRLKFGDRDPVALFGTIPSIATCLAGVVTGQWLKNPRYGGTQKSLVMAAAGLACLGAALAWDKDCPINKNLWSSSYTVYCAGFSLLLLAAFYQVIDVWRFRAWTFPLVVIGSNSILIYMACSFVDFRFTANRVFGGALQHTGTYQPLLLSISVVLVEWALLYVLYRHKLFFRV
jgi:predicted acyltransferase